jgi:citrate lyase subunit beta/citryl-CoA lyase
MRLERTMLFVPATRWPVIEKAVASAADALCIDLEDSVAADEKVSSRSNVVRAFRELNFGPRIRVFRMNEVKGPLGYRDLIEVVEAAGEHIDAVMVPKVSSSDDVVFVDKLLSQIELYCDSNRRIGIEVQIETAAGLLNVREIAASSSRLEALIFGPSDYAASLGMPLLGIGEFDQPDDRYLGHRWHAPMHAILAAARANGLRCIDGPYGAYEDGEGLERLCRIAQAMGFDGKQCIHPRQLAIVNSVFSPSEEHIARAQAIAEAYQKAVVEKQGVVGLDGRAIDAANLRIAEVTLEKSRLIKRKDS